MSLTKKQDLRVGRAIWSRYPHPAVRQARLRRNVRSDIVVVGAGISGALVSEHLTATGFKPLILDRRRRALEGSTAASTALLQFELDTPLVQLSRRLGTRRAVQVWQRSRQAVNELRTRAHRLGIRAHMQSRPSLYLAGDLLDARGLQREARARQRAGIPSELLSRRELRHHFEIDRAAAILSHGNAEADPVALASGFLNVALRRGARLHAPHEVVDMIANRRGVELFTRDGRTVQARRVIFATGYELPKILSTEDHQIISTWTMATRPQTARLWPQRALIWEASDPYLYARTLPDGRVIVGGEDEEFNDAGQRRNRLEEKAAALETKLRRLFPRLDARAEFAWAGSFGSSPRGMPTIGAIPGHPNCYCVLGYGGNGITFSVLAAQLLTAALRGRPDADSRLFAFP